MGPYSSYAVLKGLESVLLVYGTLAMVLLAVLSFQLYTNLQAQDSSLARGGNPDIRSQVLIIAKRAMLWVFGYKGERRERTPFKRAGVAWVYQNKASIFFRLLPVYGLYILALVVLTRPIYVAGGSYRIFNYSTNLHDLSALFVIYVCSNIFFDYLSLIFTFAQVIDALKEKRYAWPFLKSALFATFLFLSSQVVSCFLWVYKRQEPGFPEFTGNIFRNFLEVALWPYAFVTGPGSAQITSEPFPGQLLITGTVFIPTIMLVSLFIVFSTFLKLTESAKVLLRSHKLDRFCRLFVRARVIGVFEPPEKLETFGYCNLALLALLDLSIVACAGALAARLV